MTTQSTLRDLRQISLSELVDATKSPEQKIRYEEDVAYWKQTMGYHDYQLFLRRLNESVVGHTVPRTSDSDAAVGGDSQVGADILLPLRPIRSSIHMLARPSPTSSTFSTHSTSGLTSRHPPNPEQLRRASGTQPLETTGATASSRQVLPYLIHIVKVHDCAMLTRHLPGIRPPPRHIPWTHPRSRPSLPQTLLPRIVW